MQYHLTIYKHVNKKYPEFAYTDCQYMCKNTVDVFQNHTKIAEQATVDDPLV